MKRHRTRIETMAPRQGFEKRDCICILHREQSGGLLEKVNKLNGKETKGKVQNGWTGKL